MTARISFRGWVFLASVAVCVAVWWWLLSAFFAYRAEKACQADHPARPTPCLAHAPLPK
jgi:hypothetical protein